MARQTFKMPKMGESITEATILSWSKQVGDRIELDETLLEIATDKVDSELPSPYEGVLLEILHPEGAVVAVNEPIAIIDVEGEVSAQQDPEPQAAKPSPIKVPKTNTVKAPTATIQSITASLEQVELDARPSQTHRFYSPLVRAIAEQEQLTIHELNTIRGTGADGRVTKNDISSYVAYRRQKIDTQLINYQSPVTAARPAPTKSYSGEVEIVEMDRMRRLISDHMVRSKQTSPHVTSFLEIDITNVVNWRDAIKTEFQQKYGQKITYTPIFIEAVTKALLDFPDINVSVDGYKIVKKKYFHVGMATATASGNLIVPVIKHADQMDLLGLTQTVNDLADRARHGRLQPQETQDGTFTLTNVGTFGNTLGTPIINQPQVAILSVGAIRKKPAVVETPQGDKIDIRQFMFLSLSYDHRVVDGALGGRFLRRVGDYLEGFDVGRVI